MKKDCPAEIAAIRICIRGALALYEHEGLQIFHILYQQEDKCCACTFDHIGAALLLANRKIEEIIQTPHENEEV